MNCLRKTTHEPPAHLGFCVGQMANGVQNQEGVPENLSKQLAVAVRSIQWSYAIFWSLSTRQQGMFPFSEGELLEGLWKMENRKQKVLEWSGGYYNGDIKTRKTVQEMELKADKMGLQRSEQLRELYESLLEGETDQQSKRPSAALSPEDLSDAEWYYLVCMSFVFNPGEGLPGRALANGQSIWLCDAQYADSKVFSRSLLAKTVVCFPHMGGVIELGVTELVPEDPSLIQHIKACLLELSKPICSEKSSFVPCNTDDDKDRMCAKVDHDIVETMALEKLYPATEEIKFEQEGMSELHGNIHEEHNIGSPDDCSNGCEDDHQTEDSFMLEGINGGASQVQSWHFVDDDFSNGVQGSMDSSDCISQAFVNQERIHSPPKGENVNNVRLKDLQECNDTKFSSLDLGADDDLHYRRTISTVLRKSHPLIGNSCFRCYDIKSSFITWKKGGMLDAQKPQTQQRILKKILFTVPLMHGDKKREKEKFLVLRSMVPSINKIDEVSILGDTIEYLKKLEARVEELETSMDLQTELDARARQKYLDMVEQTSDNYDDKMIDDGKKLWINKRKACDIDETDLEINEIIPKDSLPSSDMKVRINEQEFRGRAVASAGMIKQALWRITSKC
ncbi:Transcription factor GLABRA 3 [Vitis vinifera]|uniref:Transcription factor GLABRA 3 n=1 Tax=Vitis vinifera TaxID=29760 RepID=A0A438JM69_VITVI|nr:Transcription factor GLABRA 3 [Vitis vinifera]